MAGAGQSGGAGAPAVSNAHQAGQARAAGNPCDARTGRGSLGARFRPWRARECRLPLQALSAALAVAGLLAGCSRGGTAVERGDREQALYRGIGYEVQTLDPQRATGIAEQTIAAALFEGLVREDAKDLHPVPGVADRWDISADGLRYRFHLRSAARWSDGSRVTAEDFVESWKRIRSPLLGAQNAGLLDLLASATATSADALTVTLKHPAPYFLPLLCHMAWLPVPVRAIAARGAVDSPDTRWAQPGLLIGNGPFVLRSWVPDQEIVVEKSPTYWDAANVRLHAVHFYPIDSLDAEERAFRAGQLHVTDAIPPARIAVYRRDDPKVLRIDPYLATYFYRINVRRPYLSDPRIRRALALAIDRQAIVARILQGGERAASWFTPPGLGGYRPDPIQRTDFDAARRLLAAAGHPHGQGLPAFRLSFNTSELHRSIAEAVQETWRRELGINVVLRNQENTTFLASEAAGDYDIARASWIADYPDPTSFLDIWRSGSGNNRTGWADAAYDKLLDQAEAAAGDAERLRLLRQAEDRLLLSAPLITIYFYTHVFLIQPSVQGWYPTLLDHHPLQDVWLTNPSG